MQWQYRYGGVFVVRTHDGRHSEETGYRLQPGAAGCAGFIMNGRPSDARQKARITAAWALPYVVGKRDRLSGLLCLSNIRIEHHQLSKVSVYMVSAGRGRSRTACKENHDRIHNPFSHGARLWRTQIQRTVKNYAPKPPGRPISVVWTRAGCGSASCSMPSWHSGSSRLCAAKAGLISLFCN